MDEDDEKLGPFEVYDPQERYDERGDLVCCIYGIFLKSHSCLFYVGSTTDLYRKVQQHKCYMSNPNRKDFHRPLYRNMRFNDFDDYEFRILEKVVYLDQAQMTDRKNYYIKELDPMYNHKRA